MKRAELEWQILKLQERIKTLRPRSEGYYNDTRKLRDLVIERIRRDLHSAKQAQRKAA